MPAPMPAPTPAPMLADPSACPMSTSMYAPVAAPTIAPMNEGRHACTPQSKHESRDTTLFGFEVPCLRSRRMMFRVCRRRHKYAHSPPGMCKRQHSAQLSISAKDPAPSFAAVSDHMQTEHQHVSQMWRHFIPQQEQRPKGAKSPLISFIGGISVTRLVPLHAQAHSATRSVITTASTMRLVRRYSKLHMSPSKSSIFPAVCCIGMFCAT